MAAGRGNTETVRDRVWAGVPLAVRVVVAAAVAVFVYGTAVHLGQLAAGGWHPYRGLPGWLAGYFVALTVLDPVAAGLLACRRRAGLVLGCAVLLSDAAGNGYADYAQSAPARASLPAGPGRLSSPCWRSPCWPRPRASGRGFAPPAGPHNEYAVRKARGRSTTHGADLTKAKQPAQHTHAPQLTGTAPESAVSAGTCQEPATYVTFVANPQERRPAITHTL